MPKKYSRPTVRIEFAKRLKQLRVEKGFHTARSFAVALEIDENRYTRYERAEVEPDLTRFVMMCHEMKITPNDLLGFPPPAPLDGAGLKGHGETDGLDGKSSMSGPAFELAEAIVEFRRDGSASRLDRVTRTSQLVSDILNDPFHFVGRKLGKLLPANIDDPSATRLGVLAEAVMDAAKRDAMGHGSRLSRRP